MKKYAVVDIGSNTMVLVIYQVDDTSIRQVFHISTATHLVDDIVNHHMQESGLTKARQTVLSYLCLCIQQKVDEVYADITECGRGIDNSQEFIDTIKQAGIENTILLSGEQEAVCDFYGSQLDKKKESGIIVDIGGGSTEFVRFENHQVIDAVSIPLGCVRLSHLPLDPNISKAEIEKVRVQHPDLTDSATAVGVGGTVRACKKICKNLYKQKGHFSAYQLERLYAALIEENPTALELVKKYVSKDRQDVFIPGLGMLVAASRSFHIQTFYNSDYGVREGFLIRHILNDNIQREMIDN